MGNRDKAARLLGAAAMVAALAFAAPAAAQRQIISAVGSDPEGGGSDDTQVGTTAGALVSTAFGGVEARALTDFGVNKIYAQGNASHEAMASSAWLDAFTVGGAAGSNVRVSFSFTIDGAVGGASPNAEWNYTVYALRGGGWTMNGFGGSTSYGWDKYFDLGSDYDTLILQQVAGNRVTRADMRDFDGFYNYANNGGQPGAIQSNVQNFGFEVGGYYQVTNGAGMGGAYATTRYYADRFERSTNGGPFVPGSYSAPGIGPAMLATLNGLKSNYSLLAVGGLCAGACSDMPSEIEAIDPWTFELSFDLTAGSVFTLASWLYADDVNGGVVDFFNTAKVSSVSVSSGGSLTSASGALQALPGGGYGYPAAAESAVPEPATWAMMIAGFGMIGGAMRRRRAVVALA